MGFPAPSPQSSAFLGFGSEEALRHIGDTLAEGLFTTDAEGRITYWNRGAERITGWTARDALGSRCSLLAGDAVNGCTCGPGPVHCGLAATGRRSKRCTTRTKDGRLITIVKSAVSIRDATGEHVGALESFTPVKDADHPVQIGSGLCGLVGRDPAMLELYRLIKLVASSPATVLIAGESGTGKHRVAEAIHALGPRATQPLVVIPCAAFEERVGDAKATLARGGTVLLEEIGDLSPSAQRAVLEIEKGDALRTVPRPGEVPGVRVLCTTSHDLGAAVDGGRFRPDLFFRLNVFPLRVPALREHLEDVPLIAEHVLRRGGSPSRLAEATGYALMAYRWPGNVRELENALEYAVLRSGGDEILPDHLPPAVLERQRPVRASDERAMLAETLARCGGSRELTARALGISRITLWRRLKKHGVIRKRRD